MKYFISQSFGKDSMAQAIIALKWVNPLTALFIVK